MATVEELKQKYACDAVTSSDKFNEAGLRNICKNIDSLMDKVVGGTIAERELKKWTAKRDIFLKKLNGNQLNTANDIIKQYKWVSQAK